MFRRILAGWRRAQRIAAVNSQLFFSAVCAKYIETTKPRRLNAKFIISASDAERGARKRAPANGYEAANMSVFYASSLTSTSFSKVHNGVKSPGMIPPSTSAGITVSWFSIIYPHQVEKHNPDSPFNSLSLSCSPHVIVVLRTKYELCLRAPSRKWVSFEVGKFAL